MGLIWSSPGDGPAWSDRPSYPSLDFSLAPRFAVSDLLDGPEILNEIASTNAKCDSRPSLVVSWSGLRTPRPHQCPVVAPSTLCDVIYGSFAPLTALRGAFPCQG